MVHQCMSVPAEEETAVVAVVIPSFTEEASFVGARIVLASIIRSPTPKGVPTLFGCFCQTLLQILIVTLQ